MKAVQLLSAKGVVLIMAWFDGFLHTPIGHHEGWDFVSTIRYSGTPVAHHHSKVVDLVYRPVDQVLMLLLGSGTVITLKCLFESANAEQHGLTILVALGRRASILVYDPTSETIVDTNHHTWAMEYYDAAFFTRLDGDSTVFYAGIIKFDLDGIGATMKEWETTKLPGNHVSARMQIYFHGGNFPGAVIIQDVKDPKTGRFSE
ncbi:unnamed protein product, partial [Mesorhabditis spiculigera]